ncbi:MAG: class I SAM-dependent methyltransferase [Patescibacteria group bacterium]
MAYDENFYALYLAYLGEKTVRASHSYAFECFRRFIHPDNPHVIDLGCGLGEYSTHGHYADYAGIDLNSAGQVKNFTQADYHDLGFVAKLPFVPNAFVSLFSIECCHSAESKYALYEKIFTDIPSVKYALVGGFFYESKRGLETVGEAGGIVSYQTIENPTQYISRTFSELRIHLRTPSKMFGEDVVEVWKILSRY